tara:strand:+ start:357 stop:815 length:459 start_codon:yes stop_codon:yes gene_type:complete
MEAPSNTSFAIKNFWSWLFRVLVLHSFFITFETNASELEKDKAKAVIEAQIQAMAIDDWPKAYSFASPDIRKRFGSPQRFKEMVLKGYKIVYRPRSISFQRVENFGVAPGFIFHMIGTDGQAARVVYLMIKDEDEGWRIAGVQLFNIKGKII